MEFVASDLLRQRAVPPRRAIGSAVTALFDEYEDNGDRGITMLGQGHRPGRAADDRPRQQMHRDWV